MLGVHASWRLRSRVVLATCLIGSLAACASGPSTPGAEQGSTSESGESGDSGTPPDFFGDQVLNIAHRGGADEVPEHTLFAYAHATEVGADVIEIDLHLSADKEIFAIHDDSVDRTTEGTGTVAQLSRDELLALDAGYQFTTDEGASFPHRGQGLHIPTLEQIFDAQPDALFAVELKADDPELAQRFAEAVQTAGMTNQVFVWSGHVAVTDALRAAPGDLFVGLNFAEQLGLAGLSPEDEPGYVAPGPFAQIALELNGFDLLDEELIERAHRHEILVHAWTVNDPAQMRELIAWGVDGIITDRPSELAAILAE